MRKDKPRAILLRRSGKTYAEISRELEIPVGTLSEWFRHEPWAQAISAKNARPSAEKVALMNQARKASKQVREELLKTAARETFVLHWPNVTFVAGLALYWGEGDKRTRHQVRITNTDPRIIRGFLHFLRVYGGEIQKRIWVSLIIYEDLDMAECESFWQKETGIDASRFHKTVTIQGRGTGRRSLHGICVLGISSTPLKTTMLVWIDEMAKRL